MTGCGTGPPSRLAHVLGTEALADARSSDETFDWSGMAKIGLSVYSDETGPEASPAISPMYLEILTRRTEVFLKQSCGIQDIQPHLAFPPSVRVQRDKADVPFQIVILFSGREIMGPEKIGEATVMTQMNGVVIEHTALAEVAVFRTMDGSLVYRTSAVERESLEQLDAPIGATQPSAFEAREILRAHAAQQALDRALAHVASVCREG